MPLPCLVKSSQNGRYHSKIFVEEVKIDYVWVFKQKLRLSLVLQTALIGTNLYAVACEAELVFLTRESIISHQSHLSL